MLYGDTHKARSRIAKRPALIKAAGLPGVQMTAATYIVAIKDLAINQFGNPQPTPHTQLALRLFGDEANRVDPNNMIQMHPKDFELWLLGTYNPDTGTFQENTPTRLARAVDLVNTTHPTGAQK